MSMMMITMMTIMIMTMTIINDDVNDNWHCQGLTYKSSGIR